MDITAVYFECNFPVGNDNNAQLLDSGATGGASNGNDDTGSLL